MQPVRLCQLFESFFQLMKFILGLYLQFKGDFSVGQDVLGKRQKCKD
jgi:hypothetical protein